MLLLDHGWIDISGEMVRCVETDIKNLRTRLIRQYLCPGSNPELQNVVCFTSGNAGKALIDHGFKPALIGPNEDLTTDRWWTPSEIKRLWPEHFDASPGLLPMHLMAEMADHIRKSVEGCFEPDNGRFSLNTLPSIAAIPTGSGESILTLSMAFPEVRFIAVVNADCHTQFCLQGSLSGLVLRRFQVWDSQSCDWYGA